MTPKKSRLIDWDGPLPEAGHYLQTPSGSVYLVIGIKPNTRPNPKSIASLDMIKFDQDEIKELDPDRITHYFKWISK